MLKLKWIVLIVGVVACTESRKERQGSLVYAMKTVRVESKGGCAADDLPCARFEITYPEFKNLSVEVAATLLDKINYSIAYDNPETDGFSMEQLGEEFVTAYETFKRNDPDYGIGWYFNTQVTVNVAADTLISLASASEYFTGGAHGGYAVYYININPVTGEEVTLRSVLKPGHDMVLTSEGEKAFRTARGLSEMDDLAEHGFEFRNGAFQLNTNYGFKEEGIVFFFNPYEIAAYAVGPTEIVIPWEVLGEWRR
jgi:hypothetical protein